jgi:hypothetical protein
MLGVRTRTFFLCVLSGEEGELQKLALRLLSVDSVLTFKDFIRIIVLIAFFMGVVPYSVGAFSLVIPN